MERQDQSASVTLPGDGCEVTFSDPLGDDLGLDELGVIDRIPNSESMDKPPFPRLPRKESFDMMSTSLPSLQGSEVSSLRSRAYSDSTTSSYDTLGRRKRRSSITVRVEEPRNRRTPSYDFSVLSDDDFMLDFDELLDVQKSTRSSFRLNTSSREVVIVPPSPTRSPSLLQRLFLGGKSKKQVQEPKSKRIVPRIVPKSERRRRKYVDAVDDFHMPYIRKT